MSVAWRGVLASLKAQAGLGRGLLLLVLVLLAVWAWRADESAPYGRLSWLVYDAAQQWLRQDAVRDPRIVIVDIDEAALEQYGRWPWPRDRLAELIDAIQAADPAVVGLDILLPEPSEPQLDRRLAQALAAENLIAATAFAEIGAATQYYPPRAQRQIELHPSLRSDMQRPQVGHITPLHDADGNIRRLYPHICFAHDDSAVPCTPTLALAMLENTFHMQAREEGDKLCVAGFCQWLDNGQRLLIPFHHPSRFDYLSAAAVLQGEHRALLADRLVLVGTSAAGLGDLVVTPRGALTPGVELHALMLAAWLDSYRWQPLPYAKAWKLAGLAVLGLVLLPGIGLLATRRWQWALLGLLSAILLALPPLLARHGWWLDPWTWWLALLAAAMFWLGWERLVLWRRHRHLVRLFGAYVPASVLRHLNDDDGERRFAPQRRWLVVLFSDIRNFTALSERLPPERLVELTNHVFSELTEVVHAHGGTLDKYIGDSLMAFWGAPIATGHEARQALACSVAMQQRLVEVNRWCLRHGFEPIAMNIGMEAGDVTVGNLGSRFRLAYTALGPAVNLAARLEEQAAKLDEPILIGPALASAYRQAGTQPADASADNRTAHLGGEAIELVTLGQVDLKGLASPVAIWKPCEVPGQ